MLVEGFNFKNNPLLYGLRVGIGKTYAIVSDKLNLSLLLNVLPNYESNQSFKLFNQPELILTIPISEYFKSLLSISYTSNDYSKFNYHYLVDYRLSSNIANDYQLTIKYLASKYTQSFSLSFNLFL